MEEAFIIIASQQWKVRVRRMRFICPLRICGSFLKEEHGIVGATSGGAEVRSADSW